MRGRVIWILAAFICMGGLSPAEAASDLSGKLNLSVAGREQGIFEKATVKFEKQNPRVRVKIPVTDSATSLAALADGSADIVVLGRTLKPEEKEWTGTIVGWEGIAIIVNASNRVQEVTLQQVADLFAGKAKTWDELGGLENKITVINREEGKGIRPYLEQQLNLVGKFVNGKGVVEPDKEAIRVVSGTLTAVSYINLSTGLGNVSVGVPIRLLSLNKVDPELANVSSGAYPLRRPIVLVTKTPPSPVVKTFVDFMLDKEGQKTIQEEEFVPILVTK
ncbi:MAG TPA: substrate-binding domain-containing protein [Nitrospirales bacterium]|nr:substrate-binding domain-containing protein [Nitrospirales bacterium]